MKRPVFCLLLLIAVFVAGAYFCHANKAPSSGAITSTTEQQKSPVEQLTTIAPPSVPLAVTRATALGGQLSAAGFIEPKIYCNGDQACLQDPTTAESEADYRWLRQHGYPTREESQRLAALSEAALQDEIRKGSLTAMTELGTRMVNRGDWNGLSLFLRAADRGSIYAYYAKSKAMQIRTAPMGGIVESGAYLRVAYMLGDYKAAQALRWDVIEKYNATHPSESAMIDDRAASLYETYARSRQPVPRPRD